MNPSLPPSPPLETWSRATSSVSGEEGDKKQLMWKMEDQNKANNFGDFTVRRVNSLLMIIWRGPNLAKVRRRNGLASSCPFWKFAIRVRGVLRSHAGAAFSHQAINTAE